MLAFFERKLPKKADLVTTNTYFMRDQLINWGVEKENIVYLPNGVDTERFSEPPQERVGQLKTDLGLNGKHVIGYFGSLNLVNHPVLTYCCEVLKRVAEQIDEAKLLIVGGGNDLDQLKELVVELELSDRVVFTGWVIDQTK
jgi:1,2-diacylglycerol 3-alpha-glucosyltransferase